MRVTKFAILIPTRNRSIKVQKLLQSIVESTVLPDQVVVVASGEDIRQIVTQFEQSLNIVYAHTTVRGQIQQKILGIKLLAPDIGWCQFLDDDLLVDRLAFEKTIRFVENNSNRNIVGIGLSLPPTTRSLRFSKAMIKLSKLLLLYSDKPGAVLKSGHATSYLHQKDIVATEWLNGASFWRIDAVRNYGANLPATHYAACEDLIFSYPLRSIGEMIYLPEAKALYQDQETTNFEDMGIFRVTSYWRLYFVQQNSNLSTLRFMYSQLGRMIFLVLMSPNQRKKAITQSADILFHLIQVVALKKNILNLLKTLD